MAWSRPWATATIIMGAAIITTDTTITIAATGTIAIGTPPRGTTITTTGGTTTIGITTTTTDKHLDSHPGRARLLSG